MRRLLIACVCLGVAASMSAAQPAGSDRLPAGAILRFGGASKKDAHSPITSVAFSPDGNLVLSSDGQTAALWGIASGVRLRCVKPGAQFTPDGRSLVYGDEHGNVYAWKITTGEATRILRDEVSGGEIWVLVSPEGKTFAAMGGSSGALAIRSLLTGGEIQVIVSPEDERFSDLSYFSMAYSHDGQYLAVSFAAPPDKPRQPIWVWDAGTGKLVRKLGTKTGAFDSPIRFTKDGSLFCVHKHQVQQWDSKTGALVRQHRADVTNSGTPTIFTTSADGKLLAYTSPGEIKIHDTTTGQQRQTIDRSATALAFSPDGRSLLVGERDGSLMLWRVKVE